MKNSLVVLALSFSLFAALWSGCDSPAKNVADAKDNLQEAQMKLAQSTRDSMKNADWQIFKAEAEEKIAVNKAKITELKAKSTSKEALMNPIYEKQITDLENRNETLQHRMDDYEKYNSNWESFKREFDHDMEELGKSLKDLTVNNSK